MPRRARKRRALLPRLFTLLLLAVLAVLYVRWSNAALQTAAFDPVFARLPQGFDGCRIVVLGDLHSTLFGEDNQALIEAVQDAEPEYIFLVGDLLDAFRESPKDYAQKTAKALADIAPKIGRAHV